MSQQDVQTVRGGYDAFNRKDIPAVLYDEYTEWIEAGVGRAPAGTFRGTQSVADDGGEKWGTLMAIDLKAKGKIRWQQKTEDPLIGGVPVVVFRTGGLVAYRVQSVVLLCRLSWRAKNAGLDEI